MFGHPNNVHYNKSMRLYDWKDKLTRHLEAEEIVAYVILAGVMFIPFTLVSIF
jgi:hypothetical protein